MNQTYLQSLNQALQEVLAEDDKVYLLGEDILDPYGGSFKVTKGLSTRFPNRVISTPISEACITGIAIGMAIRGLKPVVEIMFGDFITLCADQIVNHATKFQAMYSGQVSVPLVIRTPMGGGRGYGPTHSQCLEKLFLGIPHLDIVAPSHFHDPGELLKYSILQDNGPVLFIEHKLLYPQKLIESNDPLLSIELHEQAPGYPIALVRNYETGFPDAIVISYGGIARLVESVMRKLREEEIRVLAGFPSLISSPSMNFLLPMVEKCPRVLVIEEGTERFNWSAEVAAQLHANISGVIVQRLATPSTIIPAAKHLESNRLPSVESIEQAIVNLTEEAY